MTRKALDRPAPIAAGLILAALVIGVAWFFLLGNRGTGPRAADDSLEAQGAESSEVASPGAPVAAKVSEVLAASSIEGSAIGISGDGRAVAVNTDDTQTCRVFIDEPARDISCIERVRPPDEIGDGGSLWASAEGPLITNRGPFLKGPEVFDFDVGVRQELFGESRSVWRPFDIDGDRLLIFREGLLLTTDLQGESQGNIANLPSIFTHSGLLAGDFVLVDAPELDEPTSIERYAVSDAGRARFDTSIEVEAEQVVILDHTDDAERVIVLDLRVRNFNEPDALVFIDFERSTQVSLSSPSVAGATAAGRSAWFSEDGKLVYALFADAPGSALRLFVAPIDSSDAVPGVEWTEIATWEDATSADAPPPDLRPMPWRDERFLYVGRDGGIFAVEPVFDS